MKIKDVDYSAIEARIAAHLTGAARSTGESADEGPTDPEARARWKMENFVKHYGVTVVGGKVKL